MEHGGTQVLDSHVVLSDSELFSEQEDPNGIITYAHSPSGACTSASFLHHTGIGVKPEILSQSRGTFLPKHLLRSPKLHVRHPPFNPPHFHRCIISHLALLIEIISATRFHAF